MLLTIFLFLSSDLALAARPVHSAELRALLAARNEKVVGLTATAEGAKAREGNLGRSFLPEITLYGSQERFRKGRAEWKTEPSFGAEASVSLFNGGRDALLAQEINVKSERLRAESKVAIYEELLKAREAYWKILYYRDLLALYRELEKENAASLQAAERRIRGGVATQSDRYEFEMKGLEIKQERGEAEVALSILQREFAALFGEELQGELSFAEPLTHDHEWEELLRHGESEHDFLSRPAELKAQEGSLAARRAGRSWWPEVEGFAAWRQPNQLEENPLFARDRREAVLGLRATMLLFDGGKGRIESRSLAHEARGAEALASYSHRQVEVEIHRETTELKFLHSQVHEAEENITRAKKYHALTRSEYSRGVKNSPDLIGATEKLFLVRRKRLEILRDFQVAKAHVLSIIGR
jgi:outer membrane protein